MSYKPGVTDMREAGAIKVLTRLSERGAEIGYHDPLVDEIELGGNTHRSVVLAPRLLADQDVVVILVAQHGVDWETVAKCSPLVLDCCNALGQKSATIRRL